MCQSYDMAPMAILKHMFDNMILDDVRLFNIFLANGSTSLGTTDISITYPTLITYLN